MGAFVVTPQKVGYNAAAFYRYRAPWGGDQDRKIEVMPSDQWGVQQSDAVAYWEQRHAVWRSLPYFDQITTAHAAMERRAGV